MASRLCCAFLLFSVALGEEACSLSDEASLLQAQVDVEKHESDTEQFPNWMAQKQAKEQAKAQAMFDTNRRLYEGWALRQQDKAAAALEKSTMPAMKSMEKATVQATRMNNDLFRQYSKLQTKQTKHFYKNTQKFEKMHSPVARKAQAQAAQNDIEALRMSGQRQREHQTASTKLQTEGLEEMQRDLRVHAQAARENQEKVADIQKRELEALRVHTKANSKAQRALVRSRAEQAKKNIAKAGPQYREYQRDLREQQKDRIVQQAPIQRKQNELRHEAAQHQHKAAAEAAKAYAPMQRKMEEVASDAIVKQITREGAAVRRNSRDTARANAKELTQSEKLIDEEMKNQAVLTSSMDKQKSEIEKAQSVAKQAKADIEASEPVATARAAFATAQAVAAQNLAEQASTQAAEFAAAAQRNAVMAAEKERQATAKGHRDKEQAMIKKVIQQSGDLD